MPANNTGPDMIADEKLPWENSPTDFQKIEQPFPLDEDGKDKSRDVTDRGCCCFFLFYVGVMAAIAVLGFLQGDVNRLQHGRDYHGRLCGLSAGVVDKPYLYFCGGQDRVGDFPKKLHMWSTSCVRECPTNASFQVACLMREFVNTTTKGSTIWKNRTYVSTLNIEVTQSVAMQQSYPTVPYEGAYCMPKEIAHGTALYEDVVEGPLRQVVQFTGALTSVKSGWPVLVIATIMSTVLGIAYLLLMKNYAGLLIYISMWAGTVMLFLCGFYFFFGVFFDPLNEDGWYQSMNPIFIVCYGLKARFLTMFFGGSILAVAVCFLFTTLNENIDESIGVIAAAVDCLMGNGKEMFEFLIQPIFQSLAVTVLVVALLLGLVFTASVVELDRNLMSMNGEPVKMESDVTSLMATERREWYWQVMLGIYIVGCVWVMLTFAAACHFIVSFAVCKWYFARNTAEENPDYQKLSPEFKEAIEKKKKNRVRVSGVDRATGPRSGGMTKVGDKKFLVVPVGTEGPGGRDFPRPVDTHILTKALPIEAWCEAFAASWKHLGTIAWASILILTSTPARAVSEIIKAFLGAQKIDTNPAPNEQYNFDDTSCAGMTTAGFGLLSTLIDEQIGCYSKDLYVDVVLRATPCNQAATDAFYFITDTGGIVALLHGGTAVYELVGIMFITGVCSFFSWLLLNQVPSFAPPSGEPLMLNMMCTLISFTIACAFMSLFHNTANTLLYTFAWSRKQFGKYMNNPENGEKFVRTFVPAALVQMMGSEVAEEPTAALQPQKSKTSRFDHAKQRYKTALFTTMRGTAASEERPLLAGMSGGGFSSRR